MVFIMTEDVHIHSGVAGSNTGLIKHANVLDETSTSGFEILLEISILGSLGRLCTSVPICSAEDKNYSVNFCQINYT